MANFVFNIALGRIRTYAELAQTNDAIIFVPLETTGLEADATLRDYDDLATLLGGTSNEQATMGRKSVTSAVVTVDDTNERVDLDIADQTWVGATGNGVSALTLNYDNDTTAGTDANIVPNTKHDFVITPDGSDVTAQIAATGYGRAQG
jgi:hypothetical protein